MNHQSVQSDKHTASYVFDCFRNVTPLGERTGETKLTLWTKLLTPSQSP